MKRDVTSIYYYINITSDQYHRYVPGMWFFRVPLILAHYNIRLYEMSMTLCFVNQEENTIMSDLRVLHVYVLPMSSVFHLVPNILVF